MYSFISYLISKCFHLDSFMKTWLFKSGFTTKDSPCMIIPGSHYGTLSLDQNCFTKITVIFRYLFMLISLYHVSFKTTKILLLLGSTGTSIFEKWFFCFFFFFFSLYSTSVQFSCSIVSDSLGHHGLQHTRLPSPTPRACSDSCPFSPWCHPTISSSVVLFSSCLQSFPASGSFPMSQFFISDG